MGKPLLVQVIPTLGGGGAEREVARVSKVIKEHGQCDVVVCCLRERGGFANDLEKSGVEVVVLDDKKRSLPKPFMLIQFLRSRKPLIAHSHLIRWGATAARLAGVPAVFMTEHGCVPSISAADRLFNPANSCLADKVVAVSQATGRVLSSKCGIPQSKIVVIPNAIEMDDLSISADGVADLSALNMPVGAPVIGIIGRLIPIKGHKYFISAASEVLKSRPDCRFLIIGEGPCRQEIEDQIRDMGITDRVHMLGFRNDVRSIIKSIDIACLSSLSEGTPITMLEAMACEKPAVVTNVGGNPEVVVDRETGLVVPARDPSALAEALLKLIADPDLAHRMGSAGLRRVQTEYSVERNLERLLSMYNEALVSKGIALIREC